MKIFHTHHIRGFSLVETVFYVAFLAIFSGVMINLLMSSMDVFTQFRLTREINTSATAIMERLTRDIRGAYAIDQSSSVFNVNPGRLVVHTVDASNVDTTVDMYIDNGRVKMREGGVDIGYISTKGVQVDLLVFSMISNPNTSAITTRLQLSATRGSHQVVKTFYLTTMLRETY